MPELLNDPSPRKTPIQVAIVGGGCAGITTAFELTRPEHDGRYEVTVYQLGWRLGGKGASGRGPSDRIEEHGLHVWLGYYENAFQLLRQCYRELDRAPESRFSDWRDAFFSEPAVGLADQSPDGEWAAWLARFPAGKGFPGDPLDQSNPYTVQGYMVRTAQLIVALLQSAASAEHSGSETESSAGTRSVEALLDTVARLLRYGQLATFTAVLEGAGLLAAVLEMLPGFPEKLALGLLDAVQAGARSQLEALFERDDEARRLWTVLDLAIAGLRGSIRFGLATDPRGFDAINDYEMREWLLLNGASRSTVESAFVRGLYDLGFAFEDGDPERPAIAAGAGLRGAVRMFFTYRGALFWKMKAGMGDVVFAPFYEVLERRGVRFEFFHRLENVRLADDSKLEPGERPYIEALEFDVQAKIKRGRPYRPLIDVGGLPCWPSEPDYGQLVGGRKLHKEGRRFESHWDRRKVGEKVLRVTEDFDVVVLAVSLGAIPHVCGDILARDSRWRAMVENVKTVATQAFQLWMREDMEQLGWQGPPVTLSAFVQPFDTWADMRQLIEEENWNEDPAAIAYFCSTLPTALDEPGRRQRSYPAKMREQVRQNAVHFLNHEIGALWPGAVDPEQGFRWDLLLDAERDRDRDKPSSRGTRAKADSSRFDSQFWTANVNPTDRYVLSVPGSQKYRISPLDNSYDNLVITGDWTDCGHNIGCVEAAVISGRLAATAVCGRPRLADIIGFDHP